MEKFKQKHPAVVFLKKQEAKLWILTDSYLQQFCSFY